MIYQKIISVNMMIMELLEKDTEGKMKSELHFVLPLTNKAVKTEKLLQLEIEIQWNKKELKFQKLLII
jgi:hypothetical protein